MTPSLHLLTCEYPPRIGGVAEHTRLLASELARQGEEVHVWFPAANQPPAPAAGFTLHPLLGRFGPGALRRTGKALDRCPGPRRLLLQWVPHGYGWRGLNLGFCSWLGRRARQGRERVEIILHEPFLPARGTLRQRAAAGIQRRMLRQLLRGAHGLWLVSPAWESVVRPLMDGGRPGPECRWLPISSTVPVVAQPARRAELRSQLALPGGLIAIHFGTYGPAIASFLEALAPQILTATPDTVLLLLGCGGDELATRLKRKHPDLAPRLRVPGELGLAALSAHLAAGDLALQPYPDGVSARRTTALALLAHGRPVLSTAGELTEDFWRSSGAVKLTAWEPGTFAAAALDLLRRAEARWELGRRGAAFYDQHFDLAHGASLLRGASSLARRPEPAPTASP